MSQLYGSTRLYHVGLLPAAHAACSAWDTGRQAAAAKQAAAAECKCSRQAWPDFGELHYGNKPLSMVTCSSAAFANMQA
jgi:hypothetical protein